MLTPLLDSPLPKIPDSPFRHSHEVLLGTGGFLALISTAQAQNRAGS